MTLAVSPSPLQLDHDVYQIVESVFFYLILGNATILFQKVKYQRGNQRHALAVIEAGVEVWVSLEHVEQRVVALLATDYPGLAVNLVVGVAKMQIRNVLLDQFLWILRV